MSAKPRDAGSPYRVSGKKIALEPKGSNADGVELLRRPGAWQVVETVDSDRGVRLRSRVAGVKVGNRWSATVGGMSFSGEWVDPSARFQNAGVHAAGGDSDLVAQFPGKVRKVLVTAGAQVEEGQPLVQVEAMKMEFTIKAPARGKVLAVRVSPGQALSPGDRFVDFEESPA